MCVARASRALDSVGRACGPHRARFLGEEVRKRRAKRERGQSRGVRREKKQDNERKIRQSERKIAKNRRREQENECIRE